MASQGVELRHLRYFVAVADAGTFTHAAERMFIAQPRLSQQIRRLEEMVGTPLLQRRRDGVRLTEAGAVLLEESRSVLSLVDYGVSGGAGSEKGATHHGEASCSAHCATVDTSACRGNTFPVRTRWTSGSASRQASARTVSP